jgi:hypothetical protein
LRTADVERRKHVHRRPVGRCVQLGAGPVQQHRAQARPLIVDPAGCPQVAQFLAQRAGARLSAFAAVGRLDGGIRVLVVHCSSSWRNVVIASFVAARAPRRRDDGLAQRFNQRAPLKLAHQCARDDVI